MKYSVILFIIVLGASGSTKNHEQPISSLSKYSYPAFAITDKVTNGTAFLYKKNGKIFAITNYHLRGWDAIKKTRVGDAKNLYIKLQMKDSSFQIHRAPINGEIEEFSFYERLDLMAVELNNLPANAVLTFINDIIDKNYFNKIPDEVFFYGYPQHSDSKKDVVKFHSKNYYFISKQAEGGFSGSPVIGKFKTKNGVVYRFMGVVFGWSILNNTWCIKPKSSLSAFDSLTSLQKP